MAKKSKLFLKMAAVALLFVGASTVRAQDAAPAVTLNVGDDAPALAGGDFVKGEPVKSFEKGKSYVVEFWATWCGPCRASIPHLTEMSKKYKDITFIGQDCWENDEAAVKPFVAEMGDKMDYHVVLDKPSGQGGAMAKTWMTAAGQNGIPTAFLVNGEGKIVYIGHPMTLDKVLADYTAGTFDPKKEAEKKAAEMKLQTALQSAMQSGDMDKAISVVDDAIKQNPDSAKQLTGLKFNLLVHKKDFAGATEVAKTFVEINKDDADALNFIAWTMVDPDHPYEKADLDFAEKTALKANEVSKGNSGQILDTLAHVYAAKGETAKAIETEKLAIGKAEAAEKPELQKYLDKLAAKPV